MSGKGTANAGGLIRWPVYLCIPVGFGLLGLQSLSELIKRIELLRGRRQHATTVESDLPEFRGVPPGNGTRS